MNKRLTKYSRKYSLWDRTPDYSNPSFPEPRPFQERAHEALRQGFRDGHKNQLIMAPTGGGKCLGFDTPILMSDGSIKPVQDVVAGDALMGPDGLPRNVLSVTSGTESLYRITQEKGDPYVVNASHILSLRKAPGSDWIVLSDGTRIAPGADIVNVNVKVFARSNATARHFLKGWRSGAINAFTRNDDADARHIPHLVHGISIEPIGVGPYFGFDIDGDRLFLLGDFTVTHNTYIGHRIAHEALMKGKKVVFVCDRTTLINQTSRTADEYGLTDHGIIQAMHRRQDPSLPYQIASAQTLAARDYWPEADVIIVDEAHDQMKIWTEHAKRTSAAVIGLSATPFSKGLGEIFTNLINATTMHELTQSGVLVPLRVFACRRPDMTGAATSGGEWTDRAAEERGMVIIGDVITEWGKHASDRKTIVFGSTIKHCKEIARQFSAAGVIAALYTSETTADERETILAEYHKPDSRIRVLVSVNALAKGFDAPSVSCIVDCRPLRKSLSTAIQMWGRGLRCSPGKTDCILIDHSGNFTRFIEDFTNIYFGGLDRLDIGEKLDRNIRPERSETENRGCPSCGYTPFHRRCMSCGFERQSLSKISVEAGEAHEIKALSKREVDLQSKISIWEQVCTYARAYSMPEKQAGRAWHLYRKITNSRNPPMSFEDARNVVITKEVMNKIKYFNIVYTKARFS